MIDIAADAGALALAGLDAEITPDLIVDYAKYEAVMRAPRPPQAATPYQIKREAQRRQVTVDVEGTPTKTNLWEAGLRSALQSDTGDPATSDVWESFNLISELHIDDPITDDMAEFLVALESSPLTAAQYKDDFFRNAVGRSRR